MYDSTDSFGLTKTTQRWFERHFQYNGFGIRDSSNDYSLKCRVGARRITFLGDSFTAGHGVADVEDRFANRIRTMMPGTEVHVFAQLGMDTGAQIDALMKLVSAGYQFGVVVLVYCLNDISDIVPEWQQIMHRIDETPAPGFLVSNRYLVNWLCYRWFAAHDPDVSNYYAFVRENYDGPIWEQQAQRLTILHSEVEKRGGRFLVVTFPFLHVLGPHYDYKPVHEKLDAFWREQNVPHLGLLNVFESSEPGDIVVNKFDAHPNERAHTLAATAIAGFLEEHGMQQEH